MPSWTPEEDKKLQEMIDQQLTTDEMAKRMGRTFKSVQHRRATLSCGREPKYTSNIKEDNNIIITKKNQLDIFKTIGAEIVSQFQPLNLLEQKYEVVRTTKSEEISILDISDVHIGMRNKIYDGEQEKEIITYNEEIFLKQLYNLKKSIFEIYDILKNSYTLKKLVIFVMGDIITNDRIFPEQPMEIESVVGEQIWKAIPIFTEFFNSLLKKYETIEVVCVVGNHGRSMPDLYNEPVQNNFEYFIYKTWEKQFENSKRVKIIVPTTRRYIHNIYKWKHLVEHGDAFRGSSHNAIERQIEQLYVNMGGFDVMHLGHFHKCKEMEVTDKVIVKINGGWIEKDSWAFKLFKSYSYPKQHFFGCNEKRPETWGYKLDLRG